MRLLEGGRLSIQDAAEVRCGPDDAFNRVFEGWVGVPPGAHRRRPRPDPRDAS
ncbi:hypothetical protein [Sorangium sp. So ce145]|uniref:hypothetical protein n=1 Tax=Sorangium sp. So ce145 TaxID=3133285 RepID=UPI003F6345FA